MISYEKVLRIDFEREYTLFLLNLGLIFRIRTYDHAITRKITQVSAFVHYIFL